MSAAAFVQQLVLFIGDDAELIPGQQEVADMLWRPQSLRQQSVANQCRRDGVVLDDDALDPPVEDRGCAR